MLLKFPSLSGIKWLCFNDPQLIVSFRSFMLALAGLQLLTQLRMCLFPNALRVLRFDLFFLWDFGDSLWW